MGRLYDAIDDTTRQWLAKQPMFFVATAPNDPDGHVNLSPKGAAGAFRVLGPTRVAYVDLVGSGVETAAHLRENGRIVLMFCAFAGPPKIVRLHGQGRVVRQDDPEFAALLPEFPWTTMRERWHVGSSWWRSRASPTPAGSWCRGWISSPSETN